jgi:hypothetical protein
MPASDNLLTLASEFAALVDYYIADVPRQWAHKRASQRDRPLQLAYFWPL